MLVDVKEKITPRGSIIGISSWNQSFQRVTNAQYFSINVARKKTHLVLAVSVATSGTARHFVGFLMIFRLGVVLE
jgi:hypothetical protein